MILTIKKDNDSFDFELIQVEGVPVMGEACVKMTGVFSVWSVEKYNGWKIDSPWFRIKVVLPQMPMWAAKWYVKRMCPSASLVRSYVHNGTGGGYEQYSVAYNGRSTSWGKVDLAWKAAASDIYKSIENGSLLLAPVDENLVTCSVRGTAEVKDGIRSFIDLAGTLGEKGGIVIANALANLPCIPLHPTTLQGCIEPDYLGGKLTGFSFVGNDLKVKSKLPDSDAESFVKGFHVNTSGEDPIVEEKPASEDKFLFEINEHLAKSLHNLEIAFQNLMAFLKENAGQKLNDTENKKPNE